MIVMPFSTHERDPLTDPYTPVRIPRWKTRLFRDRSKAVPVVPPVTEAQRITPPMDTPSIYEEEVYETNIARICSGMSPGASQIQSVYIPPYSPPSLHRVVTPRRGTNQGPNVNPPEVDSVGTVCSEC